MVPAATCIVCKARSVPSSLIQQEPLTKPAWAATFVVAIQARSEEEPGHEAKKVTVQSVA